MFLKVLLLLSIFNLYLMNVPYPDIGRLELELSDIRAKSVVEDGDLKVLYKLCDDYTRRIQEAAKVNGENSDELGIMQRVIDIRASIVALHVEAMNNKVSK